MFSLTVCWNEPAGVGVKKSVGEVRTRQGRNACTSFLIVDAQSVKNTDTAGQKGYDAGKEVSGIKLTWSSKIGHLS
ncbi:hypothetical protein Neut_0982 [Nitrosomonas eutropha C91]|uniref:Uncharacterized protein n=2 Tax=Nitrosomonas eutropha TaxID=916 RepID=A0ABX5M321_9PROT|nr:hypothetical protein Neut_0982 [Nitrosomonas eutropha C91]PXV72602.1 hypothetical protein C8R14_1694 [Nitrosomonas eutropha]SEI61047.1 hypothetical protein SAMN05216318_1071 [Nitrosomonas eutropha]